MSFKCSYYHSSQLRLKKMPFQNNAHSEDFKYQTTFQLQYTPPWENVGPSTQIFLENFTFAAYNIHT